MSKKKQKEYHMIDTSYIASDYKLKNVYEASNQERKEKIYFYDSIYYTRVRYNNDILKNFFKVQISILHDSYDIHQRYKNFLYIAGNNQPFGESKGFIQDDINCCLIYKFDPERTLQKLLEKDEDSFLDDTAKSKTVFAVAAILEYCHALGIGCRFIHPQSIFYDEEKNPFIANIGYSDSILNVPNSTFDRKMINKDNSIFNDIEDYVIPELYEKLNAYSFSADVYAFGTLLKKIGKDGRNKVITNIIKKCHSLTITSSEILKTLVESGDTPLFEGCDMEQYEAYKERILNNMCQTTDLEPIGDDPKSLFVNASRLLNQNEILTPEIKENILNMLISAVTPGEKSKEMPFIPAVYMLANFLESNNDTFIYDINISDKNYDPIHWMEIALKGGVFEAPFKLAEMYNRRGLFNLSKEVYNRFDTPRNIENCLCYLMANYNNKDKLNRVANNLEYKRIPEFFLQRKISEKLINLSNEINISTISTFVSEMTELCQIDKAKGKNPIPQYITGKPLYLISVLYRDGMISEKVINGIDGMVPSPAVESKKVDLSEYEKYKDEDKRIEYLKKSADLLYEPAVAEYVEYLLDNEEVDETKIKYAERIINDFFSKENCKDDCSRLKIRHAYAKLLEKKGDKKMALRIYKESADRGYIKSHVDYLRLYEDEPDKNPLIIKYYQNRKKRFEETE